MKIKPLEPAEEDDDAGTATAIGLPATGKSRFKRLFERPFLLRMSTAEKLPADGDDGHGEPSSVCLAKLVQSFMEDGGCGEKYSSAMTTKCGRSRSNCFNGNCSDSSDDELDHYDSPFGADLLKKLVPCASVVERNLLADTAMVVEKNKTGKRKGDFRQVVAGGLIACGYDAAVCKSRWDKSPNFPTGKHDYIDVVVEGQRLVVDVDFKSEFKIARPTKSYRVVLQSLPAIFVGKPERLQQVVALAAEAARRSMKRRGLLLPPWRKPEYMKAKWLAPHSRLPGNGKDSGFVTTGAFSGDFQLRLAAEANQRPVAAAEEEDEEKITVVFSAWVPPPAVRSPAPATTTATAGAGLASILREKA